MASSPIASSDATEIAARLLDLFPELSLAGPGIIVVGGAVRDLLFGMVPSEVDVAAVGARRAAADLAAATGGRFVDLGRERFISHRVVIGVREIDFAELEGGLERDLARRDCTIDAIAVELQSRRLFDPHHGRADIEARLLRMIDEQNFADDPLRVLKLVRLAVTHACSVEGETLAAMKRHAPALATIAVERIRAEAARMLEHMDVARGLELLGMLRIGEPIFGVSMSTGVLARFAPLLEADFTTRLAAIVFDSARTEVRRRLELLRWPENVSRDVLAICTAASAIIDGVRDERLALFDAGEANAQRVVLLLGALGAHERSVDAARIVFRQRSIFDMRPLLNGDEIGQASAVAPGPKLGELKRAMLEAQITGEIETVADAHAWLRRRRLPQSHPE